MVKTLILLSCLFLNSFAYGESQKSRYTVGLGLGQFTYGDSEAASGGDSYFGIKAKGLLTIYGPVSFAPSFVYFTSNPSTPGLEIQTYLLGLDVDVAIGQMFFAQTGIGILMMKQTYGGESQMVNNPAYDLGFGFRIREKFELMYAIYFFTPKKGESTFTRSWIGATYVF